MAVVQELELDRARSNPNFQCWRLSRGGEDEAHASTRLPDNVSTAAEGSYDYLHARTSLLDNHLRAQEDELYTFLEGSNAVHLAHIGPLHASNAIVAGIARPQQVDTNQTNAQDPPLDQSMAKVERRNADGPKEGYHFLISSGSGDLVLVDASGSSEGEPSPLKVTKIDGRPFCIAGAWQPRPGLLRAVVWTLQAKSDTQGAACNIYALTLTVDPQLTLSEGNAHLLLRAKLPPHAVVVSAEEDAVALAVDPLKPDSSQSGAASAAIPGAAAEMEGMEDDLPSPRTLRAAAERLAQYTSEQPDAGPTVQGQGFADVFSEMSPQDEGVGEEPECVVYCHSWQRHAPAPETPSRQETGTASKAAVQQHAEAQQQPGGAQDGPVVAAEITCSPLRVLTGQGPSLDRSSALFGLIDDVDCAVISMEIAKDPARPVRLQHVASIPALAYVATGKTQRKFMLLGLPGSGVAAVIVEANRFAYIYHSTPPSQAHGSHQVLDLSLPREASVLGAALDTRPSVKPALYVLTRDSIESYDISA